MSKKRNKFMKLQEKISDRAECKFCGDKSVSKRRFYYEYDGAKGKEVKIWPCDSCNKPTIKITKV